MLPLLWAIHWSCAFSISLGVRGREGRRRLGRLVAGAGLELVLREGDAILNNAFLVKKRREERYLAEEREREKSRSTLG